MPKKFAEGTSVPVSKTRVDLEDMLRAAGAASTAVLHAQDHAAVAFELDGRKIVIRLCLPNPADRKFTHSRVNQSAAEQPRSAEAARQAHEKACRQKWRALLLAVKAKLVSVDDGIESVEHAFMAHIVMPDGRTVAEHVRPAIAKAYVENRSIPLLTHQG